MFICRVLWRRILKTLTLEINKTSHVVLINDNINKVPRDLSEVGPDQRQFRSSVQLFGRVENTNLADTNFINFLI